MAEEIIIEMAPENTKPPFYKTRWGITGLIILALLILAALFSWWLANGKINSAQARLDTLVFTVGTENQAIIKSLYAMPGELVSQGQTLAVIETAQENPSPAQVSTQKPEQKLQEKELENKIEAARVEEDQANRIYQEAVSDHVRAQLAMRSINPNNQIAYNSASSTVDMAKSKMDKAREAFEKISDLRVSLDKTLQFLRMGVKQKDSAKPQNVTDAVSQNYLESNLVSPVQGRILNINAITGQVVPADHPVFYILPDETSEGDERWLQAWFPLTDKDKIKIGQKVSILFEKNNLNVLGKVDSIAQEPQSLPLPQGDAIIKNYTSRLYLPVTIKFDKPDEVANIAPGSLAQCQIQTRYSLW